MTVTGVDDLVDDGDVVSTILTDAAASSDPNYNGLDPADVAATNLDDDTAGVTVSPTSGLVTTEAGGTAFFTVVLNSRPTADVVIPVSSSDPGEGTAGPDSLTFTPDNWDVPQIVTVTGVDDDVIDGDVAYSILAGPAASTDATYSGLDPADVSATNQDDDEAGIIVSPTADLHTTEAGGTASFTIRLTSRPSADVTIALSSSNTAEGTVDASVTLTADNWKDGVTVTITGVDDFVADGPIGYQVVTAAAVSADANYDGLDPADISVVNEDDDKAGITVVPTSGLVTTETGGKATFTVVLDSRPTADVTIALSSSNTAEGTVGPASLTFTADNWNVPQIVTVTGVDDGVEDGSVAYSIITDPAVSADPGYDGLDPADVSATNVDDHTPNALLSIPSDVVGLRGQLILVPVIFTALEPGGLVLTGFDLAISFDPSRFTVESISLGDLVSSDPDKFDDPISVVDPVAGTIQLTTSSSTGIGKSLEEGATGSIIIIGLRIGADAPTGISPINLKESIGNTVTGVTDDLGRSLTLTPAPTDADADAGIDGAVNVRAPGSVTITPTSGLVTSEDGGTAGFTIVLDSQPIAEVTIALSSSNTAEGTIDVTSVTFTPDNWNVPQTITVTGVDDDAVDGDVAYSIITAAAVSTDPAFSGLDPADVSVTNLDNDRVPDALPTVAGFVVNDGSAQRSMVTSLTVTFSEAVTIGDGAFVLTDSNGVEQQVVISTSEVGGRTVATLTFTGAGIIGGSLADGNYQLRIVADRITDSAGQSLDGDGDGSAHDDAIESLYRFFGDFDGDRDVDNSDYFMFRKAYREQIPFLAAFDFDGDGGYTQADLDAFLLRRGKKLDA
ncbi:MAG: Calx-beta domain-containing protein [Isosphaeraceae bacterium]